MQKSNLKKNAHDFLVEIHTEELPPKTLRHLAEHFLADIQAQLTKLELPYRSAEFFVTPRRLAVFIKKLAAKQVDTVVERRGPALVAAYDQTGAPTAACLGFAKSCGITADQLVTITTAQGEWVGYQQTVLGKTIQHMMPTVIQQVLAALPIPKRMRWGNSTVEFIRPVHSVMMLYGEDIIDAEILGCKTNRLTRGHRFHSKGWLTIKKPASYVKALARRHVIADFYKRKEHIQETILRVASAMHADAQPLINEQLLEEVTGLVEWPVAICGNFAKEFLEIPAEALIAVMQDHQRYFPVLDSQQKLLPYFVTISNIHSHDMQHVIAGNQRVLHARLSDAAFFFATDKQITMDDRLSLLEKIIFQTQLGNLFEKTVRVTQLAIHIAKKINVNEQVVERASQLSKVDLTTQMVSEFPELQGIMGYHYATYHGETDEVAQALQEHYMPRFAGDQLPASTVGCVLAVAERIDTLVGIFGINQIPTGDKDPYGLRRAALGVLRILIEKKLNLDLRELLEFSAANYADKLENQTVVSQVLSFMWERLKHWYADQGITADVFAAIAALDLGNPHDMNQRIHAVQHFKKIPEAEALSVANKRVSNILAKLTDGIQADHIDVTLLENDAERLLVTQLAEKQHVIAAFSTNGKYAEILTQLATLRQPIDNFFEHVMVMSENKARKENRLLILKQLRELFLNVADIALLQ